MSAASHGSITCASPRMIAAMSASEPASNVATAPISAATPALARVIDSESSAFASAISLRTSALQSPTSRLNNDAADSCSMSVPRTQPNLFVDLDDDLVDLFRQRRCAVWNTGRLLGAARGCFHEACEHQAYGYASGYEQSRVLARECARIVDEIVDGAVAQACRKIADRPGQPVGQLGDRRFVFAELSAGSPDRLCEFIDARRGRALALLQGLAAVFLQALCEPAARARGGSGIGLHRGAPLNTCVQGPSRAESSDPESG